MFPETVAPDSVTGLERVAVRLKTTSCVVAENPAPGNIVTTRAATAAST